MATRTIETNENNDLFLPDGRNLSIIEGASALSQNIRHAHLMRKGEDLYDVNNGVDYFGTVFSSPKNLDAARQSLSNAILKKNDVRGIELLDISLNGEVLDFTAQIITIYGETLTVGNSNG